MGRRHLPPAAAGIGDAGVKLCLEPLSPPDANFINTAAEGVEIIRRSATRLSSCTWTSRR